jgi:hypothetical protein
MLPSALTCTHVYCFPARPSALTCVLLSCPSLSFDLVFLDANKDGYQSYYNTILDKHLLAPGGLLVVDNTLMKVRVCGGDLVRTCYAVATH